MNKKFFLFFYLLYFFIVISLSFSFEKKEDIRIYNRIIIKNISLEIIDKNNYVLYKYIIDIYNIAGVSINVPIEIMLPKDFVILSNKYPVFYVYRGKTKYKLEALRIDKGNNYIFTIFGGIDINSGNSIRVEFIFEGKTPLNSILIESYKLKLSITNIPTREKYVIFRMRNKKLVYFKSNEKYKIYKNGNSIVIKFINPTPTLDIFFQFSKITFFPETPIDARYFLLIVASILFTIILVIKNLGKNSYEI